MAVQFSVKDNRPWKGRFFTIWGGQAFSLVGSQLVQFALIWYLTVETGSATVLAVASLVGTLPQVLLGPFVGTLVDRWNRRRIMLAADSMIAIFTILLSVLFFFDLAAVWQIYLVMLVRSLAGSFHGNAMNASTSLMVPVEHLTRIQGVNQMLNGGLNVISAPLGALLLGLLPIQGVLLIDVGTALLAVLPLCFLQVPQPERKAGTASGNQGEATVWEDFQAGWRYLLGWPGLLLVGAMTIGINFTVIPAFALLPLMVKEYFGGSAVHLSWVESAMGIGIIAGGALLGAWGGFRRRMLTSMLGLIGMGLGTLLIAAAPPALIILAVGGALLFGIMNPITMGPFFAVIQSKVEPDMQARVLTLMSSVGGLMAPVGLMIAGPVSDHFGIKVWFFLGGVLCLLMGIAGFFLPAVLNLDQERSPAENQAPLVQGI
jgi:DHA3 family macrolide efflux protein-like MFS transporter